MNDITEQFGSILAVEREFYKQFMRIEHLSVFLKAINSSFPSARAFLPDDFIPG